MRSGFVVVAARPGWAVPLHVVEHVGSPDPAGLPFPPAASLRFADDRGLLVAGAWQEEHPGHPPVLRWRAEGRRAVLTVGSLRRRGRPWGAEGTWAGALDDIDPRYVPAGLADDIEGLFQAAVVTADGNGSSSCDLTGALSSVPIRRRGG